MKLSILEKIILVAAVSDGFTGLALVFWPSQTLSLMQIAQPDVAWVFIRWLGIFVGMTGVWLLLPFRHRKSPAFRPQFSAAVLGTAWVRLLVSCFLIWAVTQGQLVAGWCFVAAFDGSFGLMQLWAYFNGEAW